MFTALFGVTAYFLGLALGYVIGYSRGLAIEVEKED